MDPRVILPFMVLAALATPALGCIFQPEGCIPDMCKLLPTRYPNPSLNFSLVSSWNTAAMRRVAFYRGVYTKLGDTAQGPKPDTLAKWLQLKGMPFIINLEKAPVENNYVIRRQSSSLAGCCDVCRVTYNCSLYLFQPAQTTNNYDLSTPSAGTCILLSGGTFLSDGPFDKRTGRNYGSPFGGDRTRQALSTNPWPMAYIGGACNPGNTTTNVVDDPHFTGAHGTRFEFNGQLDKTYCLVTDERVHVNALLKGYKSENTFHASVGTDGKAIRSWIRELGLIWMDSEQKQHSLRLVARSGKNQERGAGFISSAQLDGAALALPVAVGQTFQGPDASLTFLGVSQKGWYEVEHWSFKVGSVLDLSFDMRVAHPKLQSPEDAEVHFNLIFNSLASTERVHGVLGQTYRNSPEQVMKAIRYSALNQLLGEPIQADGRTGKGFLEGPVADYVASDITTTDCKVSSFVVAQ